jgi:hypothetical protein
VFAERVKRLPVLQFSGFKSGSGRLPSVQSAGRQAGRLGSNRDRHFCSVCFFVLAIVLGLLDGQNSRRFWLKMQVSGRPGNLCHVDRQ